MLVVGDKEAETGDVAVRNRHGGQTVMSFDAFAAKLRDEVDSKALEQNGPAPDLDTPWAAIGRPGRICSYGSFPLPAP